MATIDTTSYDKAGHYPVGHGYSTRVAPPTAIVIHSTSNSKPDTVFSGEATYLYASPDVSAHFLIGKDGRIVQFLGPRAYQAWHAGGRQADGTWTAQAAFANPASIGIELHHSTPDPFYPTPQLDALAWLVRQMAALFRIPPAMIETHGQIALPGPYDRKRDPEGWTHADFLIWRTALFSARRYQAGMHGAIAQQDRRPDAPAAKLYQPGEPFEGDGELNGYVHDRTGIGFVPLGQVVRL